MTGVPDPGASPCTHARTHTSQTRTPSFLGWGQAIDPPPPRGQQHPFREERTSPSLLESLFLGNFEEELPLAAGPDHQLPAVV